MASRAAGDCSSSYALAERADVVRRMEVRDVLQGVGDAVDEVLLRDDFHDFELNAANILARRACGVSVKFSAYDRNEAGRGDRWRIRRTLGGAPARACAGVDHAHRSQQPSPVSAAAVPGGHGGTRRALDRRATAPHPARPAQCHGAHGRSARQSTRASARCWCASAAFPTTIFWSQAAPRMPTSATTTGNVSRPASRRSTTPSRSGAVSLSAFEEAEAATSDAQRDACLTFAVIGAGPTGVELAGTLAEIARHTLARDFRHIDPRKARVLLIEAGPRVLATFTEDLSAKAHAQLARLGVEVHTGTPVTEIGAGLPAVRRTAHRGAHHSLGGGRGCLAAGQTTRCRAGSRRTRACAAGPEPRRASRDFRGRRPRERRAGRQTGAGRRAGGQTDGRARGAQHHRANRGTGRASRSTTPTSARSRPSDDIPPSRNCQNCVSPAHWRGGSGCCCTYIF